MTKDEKVSGVGVLRLEHREFVREMVDLVVADVRVQHLVLLLHQVAEDLLGVAALPLLPQSGHPRHVRPVVQDALHVHAETSPLLLSALLA